VPKRQLPYAGFAINGNMIWGIEARAPSNRINQPNVMLIRELASKCVNAESLGDISPVNHVSALSGQKATFFPFLESSH